MAVKQRGVEAAIRIGNGEGFNRWQQYCESWTEINRSIGSKKVAKRSLLRIQSLTFMPV